MTSADATILMQNALIWTVADVPDLELAAAHIRIPLLASMPRALASAIEV